MTPERDPWNREPQNGTGRDGRQQGRGPGRGPWLWLLLVAGFVALVWFLFEAFPQRQLGEGDWIQLVKISAILLVVSSGVLVVRRAPLGETLRNLALWGLIGGVLLIGYAYRDDFTGIAHRLGGELMPSRAVEVGDGVVELRASSGGHFVVAAEVNGQPVDFLVDTGASDIVLSPADAARLGYHPENLRFTRQYTTANGIGRGAPIRLDSLAIGPIAFSGVPASVNEAPMSESLLGMTFLRRLDSYEFRGDTLLLRR